MDVFDYFTNFKHVTGKTFCIDIDGVLCVSNKKFLSGPYEGEYDYAQSYPMQPNIDLVNFLYENNKIIIYTARGKRTGNIDWDVFTKDQLSEWGVKYHHYSSDKPHFDLMWDDRTVPDRNDFMEALKNMA